VVSAIVDVTTDSDDETVVTSIIVVMDDLRVQ